MTRQGRKRERLSAAEARRIALAAQGFADGRPAAPDGRALRKVLKQVGLLQIDSVNVLARGHYLTLFGRFGPYPPELVDKAAWYAPRRLFEYWGHEASLLPVATQPLLRWRMQRAHDDAWGGIKSVARTRKRVAELAEAGELLPVEVEGWSTPAYLWHGTTVPRRVEARALVGPFDSLLWERLRVERLFDFRYRIEIYVPGPKRVHGYYVLPFLLGDRLVGRVDLKSDRAARVLRVLAAHAEPDAPPETATALIDELRGMADWLGLERVRIERRGDLGLEMHAAHQVSHRDGLG